ncbi:hypothetical protein D3C71_417730 [compost metagenome]
MVGRFAGLYMVEPATDVVLMQDIRGGVLFDHRLAQVVIIIIGQVKWCTIINTLLYAPYQVITPIYGQVTLIGFIQFDVGECCGSARLGQCCRILMP